jgi:hypothetical protein
MMYEMTTPSKSPLSEPLIANLDRGSLMLPTTGPNGKKEWMADRIPHFDMNPYLWTNQPNLKPINGYCSYDIQHFRTLLSEGNNASSSHAYPKLRAVLQLSNSISTTGGFECLPGFHTQLSTWCELNPLPPTVTAMSAYGYGIKLNDPIEYNLQKITVRAGSLILFSAELPHTMFPNESDQFRYAQYLRMTPLSTLQLTTQEIQQRKALLQLIMPPNFIVSKEIGYEVFLFDQKEEKEEETEITVTTSIIQEGNDSTVSSKADITL